MSVWFSFPIAMSAAPLTLGMEKSRFESAGMTAPIRIALGGDKNLLLPDATPLIAFSLQNTEEIRKNQKHTIAGTFIMTVLFLNSPQMRPYKLCATE